MVHCVVIRAALCRSNLRLMELGVRAEKLLFLCNVELQIYIYYFVNPNQLYVNYDMFWMI
jgi:hypothetical protein